MQWADHHPTARPTHRAGAGEHELYDFGLLATAGLATWRRKKTAPE